MLSTSAFVPQYAIRCNHVSSCVLIEGFLKGLDKNLDCTIKNLGQKW